MENISYIITFFTLKKITLNYCKYCQVVLLMLENKGTFLAFVVYV